MTDDQEPRLTVRLPVGESGNVIDGKPVYYTEEALRDAADRGVFEGVELRFGSDTVFAVGEFALSISDAEPDTVYIARTDGEGGGFDAKAFEAVVRKFYEENF